MAHYKLSPEDATMIKALLHEKNQLRELAAYHRAQARKHMQLAMNLTHEKIGEKFSVGEQTIACIATGRRWGNV